MRAALLLGSERTIPEWQYQALELAIKAGLEVPTVLHCTHDQSTPVTGKHMAYRLLNLSARQRLPMLRTRDIEPLLGCNVQAMSFESVWDQGRQRIPDEIAEQLDGHQVVVNFGMELLANPEELPVTHGVIAYDQANLTNHRDQLIGFYELASGQSTQHIAVEKLSNTRSDHCILAEAHARVTPTSYRATINDAYTTSIPLLAKALEAIRTGATIPRVKQASERQQPTNQQVIRTVGKMAGALISRGLYGAFREKRWNVAFVPQPFDPENPVQPNYADLQPLTLPQGYTFAADPCGMRDGQLYVEVMNAHTGKGEILAYENGTSCRVEVPVNGGHLSYPQVIEYDGTTYLFPEMALVGPPRLFPLDEERLIAGPAHQLAGLEHERIVDGTLLEHEDRWYLFGGRLENVNERLELWVSDNPFGPWTPHPETPICLDPRTARMGGPVIQANGRLYRVGQDGSVGYGQGATINRIEKLTPTEFHEVRLSPFRIQGAFGPHTILPTEGGYWLDYYTEKTTPLAGIRRIKGRLK